MKKQVKAVLAVLLSAGLAAGTFTAMGDDFPDAGAGDANSDISQSEAGGGSLFEDYGNSVSVGDGISADTLQDAIDSGNQDALNQIADGVTSDQEAQLQLEIAQTQEESETSEVIGELEDADPVRIAQTLQDLSAYDSLTGSDDELRTADYIASRMKDYGYTVQTQAFHEGFVDATGNDEQGLNIIAERGADSRQNRKKEIFLAVTHYDTRRDRAEGDPFVMDRTGTAVMLEAARILAGKVTDTDICFVFLSGEEDGLYGSEGFLKSLDDDVKSRISGLLDVERIGYEPETFCVVRTKDGKSNWVGDLVREKGMEYDQLYEETESEDSGQSQTEAIRVVAGKNGAGETVISYLADANLQSHAAQEENSDTENGTGTETETESETPRTWDYLSDQRYTQDTFAEAGIPSVSLTQYFGEREGLAAPAQAREEDQSETNAPAAAGNQSAAQTQKAPEVQTGESQSAEEAALEGQTEAFSEAEDGAVKPDSALLAKAADIVAEVIASVMDPQ